MLKRSIPALIVLALLTGCQPAAVTKPTSASTTAAPTAPLVLPGWVGELQIRAAALPAAQITTAPEGLSIAYPQDRLFTTGSAIPLAGGPEVLDPLSDLLLDFPEANWEATVQAATTNGDDYDRALAEKRSELLQRYLHNRGIAAGRIAWSGKNGSGAPLELVLRPVQRVPASSAGVKE